MHGINLKQGLSSKRRAAKAAPDAPVPTPLSYGIVKLGSSSGIQIMCFSLPSIWFEITQTKNPLDIIFPCSLRQVLALNLH